MNAWLTDWIGCVSWYMGNRPMRRPQGGRMTQVSDIASHIDSIDPEEYTPDQGSSHVEETLLLFKSLSRQKDHYWTFGITASCLLHLAVFLSVYSVVDLTPAKALLKPGEQVNRVRLVEFPTPPPEKPGPEPDQASAISDRSHKAERERLPKMVPGPRPPLGRVAPPDRRIASLSPPLAPEELLKPDEEKARKAVEPKASPEKKASKPKPSEGKKPAAALQERDPRRQPVDLRPTPGEMARALAGPQGSSNFYPEGNPDEPVVDIDTRDDKFYSYLIHLKRKIEGVWVYPRAAATSGLGGQLTVEFLIKNDGELLATSLLDSSGHAILDESAMRAIKTAAPYHPFPPQFTAKRIRIRAKFIYFSQNFFHSSM